MMLLEASMDDDDDDNDEIDIYWSASRTSRDPHNDLLIVGRGRGHTGDT